MRATAGEHSFAPIRFDFAMTRAPDDRKEPLPVAMLADETETVRIAFELPDVEKLAEALLSHRPGSKQLEPVVVLDGMPPTTAHIVAQGFEVELKPGLLLSLFVIHEHGRLELTMNRHFAADFAAEFRLFTGIVEAVRKDAEGPERLH